MGRTQESITIIAHRSSHNLEQDETDEQLWEDLTKEIEEVINQTKYRPISPMTI